MRFERERQSTALPHILDIARSKRQIERLVHGKPAGELERIVEDNFVRRARALREASDQEWSARQQVRDALARQSGNILPLSDDSLSAINSLIALRTQPIEGQSSMSALASRRAQRLQSGDIDVVFDMHPAELDQRNATYQLFGPPYHNTSVITEGGPSAGQQPSAFSDRHSGLAYASAAPTRLGGTVYSEACLWLRFVRNYPRYFWQLPTRGYAQIRPFFRCNHHFLGDSFAQGLALSEGWVGIWVQSLDAFGGNEKVDLNWKRSVWRSRLSAEHWRFWGEHDSNPSFPASDYSMAFTDANVCPVFGIEPDRVYFALIYVATQAKASGVSPTSVGAASASITGELLFATVWQTKT